MGGDFAPFRAKMQAAGLSEAATKAFEASYEALVSGETGMIAEDSINATDDIPYLDGKAGSIRESVTADPALLQETVVLKLNGGLGTSMGLDKAKSLLNVKGDDTFLDIMAKQVTALRAQHQSNVRFVLMNSFSTSADTLEYLAKYPEILEDENLELLQNKVPKVDAATFAPATNPTNPDKEWCPPGHGDLYPSLAGSDKLEKLLAQGVKYMFVSNSDNLGATLDLDLLTYFAQSGKPFLMECCERTENDKKGGHLAQRKADSRLILRESAQCASADEGHFQNINKHRYFNTNNLWIRLDKLKEELEKQGGVIRLPMIKNAKTVDPKDSSSTPVFQLETAMGAAIECFDGAGAVCVPRTRFAPVKKCDDLLLLRSDAYIITEDYRPVIAPERNGVAPIVSLDGKTFKLVQQLEAALRGNVPSLVKCDRLKITGKVGFAPGVVFEGNVTVVNNSSEEKTLLAGTYKDTTVDLSAKAEPSPVKSVGGDFAPFRAKMQAAGLSDAAIKAFEFSYESLVSGETGMIAEDSINATDDIPYLEGKAGSIRESVTADPALLQETVVLKLNGGLGTSMGLDKAKSLLTVKDDDTFLDIMAKQVTELRSQHQSNVRFVLMNSFSTSADTLEYLAKYPEILEDENLELLQNKVPKVDAATFAPATNPTNPGKEWCPPGHGDLYPSLAGSGKLEKLLAQGVKYMFVSNSDNLGATLDLDLLTYFAQSGKPFLMECCERTENDKKGGHLAQRKADSRLILRESAQCASADEGHFQNINKHRYFNTNNLWIRLDKLKEELEKQGGVIRLPMIKNAKTVDPKDSSSTPVFQLETAMGAAIECFDGAGAVCVPRTRFAPVKKCDDLLLLRSDAYIITEDYRPVIAPERNGVAPIVSLDGKTFKLVQQLEAALRGNVPSLVKCDRLKITGKVGFAPGVVFEGNVTVVNNSSEEKTLLAGTYTDTTVDLTAQKGLGPLKSVAIKTTPIADQKPGTSGLRKKTKTFMEGHYLHNFVQSVFDALPPKDVQGGTLVVSGDGRYFNKDAIQIIIKIGIAAGVERFWIGKDGLLSTPAVSAVIREREGGSVAFGAFILSASHNPGGPDEDFGIKYNCENGGPAPEKVTNEIFNNTKTISTINMAVDFPIIDVTKTGKTTVSADDGSRAIVLEVFDSTEDHVALLKKIFDFEAIKKLLARDDFSLVADSMWGVQGPYAHRVFVQELGAPVSCLINGTPKEDFNGGHADPNLTYAKELIKIMGVDNKGLPVFGQPREPPAFGVAWDGDADRNMILGQRFFVTPSDSLAIIAANANLIPFFKKKGGVRGVARSMPTSGAVDLVAKKLGIALFEVPTGWKFFGNLMDSGEVYGKEDYTPFICGEESFGTGSNHVREKDGMWAGLAWLSILAAKQTDGSRLVTVEDIVRAHWQEYGRNYYCRYDYENVDKAGAEAMFAEMTKFDGVVGKELNGFTIKIADQFEYHDPVDGSVSKNQGVRFIFEDGSRVVFRLSGTGVAGATVRMYIEKYEAPSGNLAQDAASALAPLIDVGLQLSSLEKHTGRKAPTVIT